MSNRGQGVGPRGAASDAGIPYRWQAADTFLSVAGISGHVNLANGNLLSVVHLSDFGGLSQVSFDLFYNSTDAGMSTVGGWRHSYSDTLEYVNDNTRIWTTSDGRLVTFTKEDSTWNAPSGVRLELMYNLAPDEWTVTDKGHNQRVFDGSGGELLRVLNDAGNPLNMSYDGSGRLETITQPLVIAHGIDANKIEISYDCNGRIDEIALPRITNPGEILMPLIGRTMEMQYDAEGRLRDSAQIT
ncbi:MAG: hypothetical protein IID37_07805 [Planctomycetes bacterium]|nr:hypothetical protein [Planctomycetota bacterium]